MCHEKNIKLAEKNLNSILLLNAIKAPLMEVETKQQ